jgi:hypothetical protein
MCLAISFYNNNPIYYTLKANASSLSVGFGFCTVIGNYGK